MKSVKTQKWIYRNKDDNILNRRTDFLVRIIELLTVTGIIMQNLKLIGQSKHFKIIDNSYSSWINGRPDPNYRKDLLLYGPLHEFCV